MQCWLHFFSLPALPQWLWTSPTGGGEIQSSGAQCCGEEMMGGEGSAKGTSASANRLGAHKKSAAKTGGPARSSLTNAVDFPRGPSKGKGEVSQPRLGRAAEQYLFQNFQNFWLTSARTHTQTTKSFLPSAALDCAGSVIRSAGSGTQSKPLPRWALESKTSLYRSSTLKPRVSRSRGKENDALPGDFLGETGPAPRGPELEKEKGGLAAQLYTPPLL